MSDDRLRVEVDGQAIDGWQEATIESDVLTPADAFTLTRAYEPKIFELLRLDAEVTISIDDAPILNGFVETRRGDFSRFTVSGKDRVGRMVAESAPLDLTYAGRDLESVTRELAAPWFDRVVFSNADNRDVMRGRGKKARGRRRPLLNAGTDARKVAAGTSKWQALDELLERAGYLAWSSADGRSLIIAQPDYDQDVQFAFHSDAVGSNCAGMTYRESNASRYAAIVTAGVGRGDDANYAVNVAQRVGIARDNAATFDGVGRSFLHPKRLVLPVEARSVEECQRLAEKERAEREAAAFEVEITAWSWGQVIPPATEPTLFTYDTVVSAFAASTPIDGAYYVTARSFMLSREQEATRLRCVPLGVKL